VGDEGFEALGGFGEAGPDEEEELGAGAVFGRDCGDDGFEAVEDGSEGGGQS
jgi:hypothetical protein